MPVLHSTFSNVYLHPELRSIILVILTLNILKAAVGSFGQFCVTFVRNTLRSRLELSFRSAFVTHYPEQSFPTVSAPQRQMKLKCNSVFEFCPRKADLLPYVQYKCHFLGGWVLKTYAN